jgi:hypothetical protein
VLGPGAAAAPSAEFRAGRVLVAEPPAQLLAHHSLADLVEVERDP